MKKGDLLWGAALLGMICFLVAPPTHGLFLAASQNAPYWMGFLKFALLASMGELLAIRLVTNRWKLPMGPLWRVVVWGLIGMLVTLMFTLYASGVESCIDRGYLPGAGAAVLSALTTALQTSILLNLFFGPSFMLFHRLTDTWIDLGQGKFTRMVRVSLGDVLDAADLKGFVSFVLFRTIPAFWIPAHTVTFLLPPSYRVLMAAMLSICLGVILSFAGKRSEGKKSVQNSNMEKESV